MGTAFFKLIHLLAVIIFLGNIITGLFWMRIAVKTKDLRIIHDTMNGIIIADRYFTIPGVIVITVGGFMAAIYRTFSYTANGMDFMVYHFIFYFRTCVCVQNCPASKKNLQTHVRDGKSSRL